MEILLWTIIVSLFVLSFVGLIYPIIPSVLVVWAGVLVYQFFINSDELSWLTWVTLSVFTVLLFIADYLANLYFVEKAGGSKWGTRFAAIGLIVGSFILPPFGVIIVPFLLVLIVEMFQKKPFNESLKVAFGTLVAFLSGTFAKAVIQVLMIVVFLLDVFI